ncbi:family 43 glycosylhydrolase [Shewanella mangrovi]|nr:family 43 glycosylhydrolase [Shewanella mangrovi]
MKNRLSSKLALLPLTLALAACASTQQDVSQATSPAAQTTPKGSFTNPLFPNGADPWLEYWDGNYYLTTTTWTSELVMRKSPTLEGLAKATPVNVWSSTLPEACCNFWAFEFHRLKGPNGYRWYMMYTAGQDGTLDHQHLNVLESAGDDPMGPYEYKGSMMPNTWNIDGTYLEVHGKLYLIYSQWQGDEQRNIIAEMENPWTLKAGTKHVVLTRPVLDWETSGRKVTEGPEILQHDGRTFLIYSGSFCDTPDYKLGQYELVGNDPMDITSWKKSPKPVFERTDKVFGPGHNGFFTSPDGKENWLVYHGNDHVTDGCGASRSLRAQKFTWHADGTPNFGKPLTPGVLVPPPSGEDGPLKTAIQGQRYQLQDGKTAQCLAAGAGVAACSASNSGFVLDATTKGFFRIANSDDGKFLGVANGKVNEDAWHNEAFQEWHLDVGMGGYTLIKHRDSGKYLALSANGLTLVDKIDDASQWQLNPTGDVAIVSQQSGKVVSSVKGNVEQSAWSDSANQKWHFKPTDNGFFHISNGDQCIEAKDDAVVPGANLITGQCQTKTSHWRITPVEGGGVELHNRYTKQVLDLSSCGLADGTNFAQAPALGTNCQVFHLRETK